MSSITNSSRLSTVSNLGFCQIVESKAIPFTKEDGQLKTRFTLSSLDTKVCLIAVKSIKPEDSDSDEHKDSTVSGAKPSPTAARSSDPSVGALESELSTSSKEASCEAKSLEDNWVYMRTRTDGSKVFVSVSSAAKRLFMPKEDIIAACSSGNFIELWVKESGTLFNMCYKRATRSLTISTEAIDFLNRNKESLITMARKSETGFIYEKFRAFPRPIEVRSDGTILVHFTKTLLKSGLKGRGDVCFGKGTFKKARAAVVFNGPHAGSLRLITTYDTTKDANLDANHEASIHKLLNGKAGILSMHHEYKVIGANGNIKSFMDLEYCEGGELFDAVIADKLNPKEKISIILDLLDGLVSLEEAGVIHRDIKLENIFLKKQDGRLRAKIGDFGLSCHVSDTVRKRRNVGSPNYVSPEYFKAARARDDDLIEALTTSKHDMFAFGNLLYALVYKNYYEGKLPELSLDIDRDPLNHLIHECLQNDLAVRIDPKTAHEKYYERFKTIFES